MKKQHKPSLPTRKRSKPAGNDHRKLVPSKAELAKALKRGMRGVNADGSKPLGSG